MAAPIRIQARDDFPLILESLPLSYVSEKLTEALLAFYYATEVFEDYALNIDPALHTPRATYPENLAKVKLAGRWVSLMHTMLNYGFDLENHVRYALAQQVRSLDMHWGQEKEKVIHEVWTVRQSLKAQLGNF